MENASKALVIAGAILVAILLISIGVLIINSTGDMTDRVGSTADTMAIETFNSQFTNYEGSAISAAQVKSLVSKVQASNATNEVTSGQPMYVSVNWGTGTGQPTSVADLKTTQKYKVALGYDNATGYVSSVTISKP